MVNKKRVVDTLMYTGVTVNELKADIAALVDEVEAKERAYYVLAGVLAMFQKQSRTEIEELKSFLLTESKEHDETLKEIETWQSRARINGEQGMRWQERCEKLQYVLTEWLSSTPTKEDGTYCEINQWHACRALEALK